jgi:hypothetical protein
MAESSLWSRFLEASFEDMLPTLYVDARTTTTKNCDLFLVVPSSANQETYEKILMEQLFHAKW